MIKINKDWKFQEKFPAISVYLTTYNCFKAGYPLFESVSSWLWAEEIVIVDGGSSDGTRESLEEYVRLHQNVKIYDIPLSNEPQKDGQLKAMARAMTSNPFLIQSDVDEICQGDPLLWKQLCKNMDDKIDIYNLLVVEPYGELGKVRINKEHTAWKWRISKNKPEITHGIPKHDRLEKDGKIYSKGFSDGTFPVHIVSNEMIPSYTPPCLQKLTSLKQQEKWDEYKQQMLHIMFNRPHVLHLGHIDLKGKLKHYLSTWHQWWCELYNKDVEDPQNNQYFPGVKLTDITEDMIEQKVAELKQSTPTIDIEWKTSSTATD